MTESERAKMLGWCDAVKSAKGWWEVVSRNNPSGLPGKYRVASTSNEDDAMMIALALNSIQR